ncbi:importin subunit beta-1-like [Temnothorax curvispinosus]|nr:importin subunit beta-1-like [Temnothorax curvispinosus]XP_024893224.1 importin subunit beta-1-like [Temnothorax curvispinosus]
MSLSRDTVASRAEFFLYMEPYMSPALFPITIEAMKSDIDEVALQGIKFWLNVYEPVFISPEGGRPSRKVYVKPLPPDGDDFQYLIRVLMKKLNITPRRQEEFEDDGSLSNIRPIRNIDQEDKKALEIISSFRICNRRHNADNQRCYLKNDSYFS